MKRFLFCALVLALIVVACKPNVKNLVWVTGPVPSEITVTADGILATWPDGHTAKYPKGQPLAFGPDAQHKVIYIGNLK